MGQLVDERYGTIRYDTGLTLNETIQYRYDTGYIGLYRPSLFLCLFPALSEIILFALVKAFKLLGTRE